MKKLLLFNSATSILLYFICYIILCFVDWEIYNPYQWILNLPTMGEEKRSQILVGILMWQFCQIIILRDLVLKKPNKEEISEVKEEEKSGMRHKTID